MKADSMSHYTVYLFACGHAGRDNEGDIQKAHTFIRVAELRGAPYESSDRTCPNCKGG
jgi:hypothetical protein